MVEFSVESIQNRP